MEDESNWHEIWEERKGVHVATVGGLKIELRSKTNSVVSGAPIRVYWVLWHSLCESEDGFIISLQDYMTVDQAKEFAILSVMHDLTSAANRLSAIAIKRSNLKVLQEMGRAVVANDIETTQGKGN